MKDAAFADAKRLRTYANSTEAAAGLIADGFDNTTEAYKAAQKYFASSPSPGRLLVSCYPASESPIEALGAVLQLTSDFYGIALADTRNDAELLELDTHLTGLDKPAMLFLALIGTAAETVATDSLLDKLHRRIPAGDRDLRGRRIRRRCRDGLCHGAAVRAYVFRVLPVLQNRRRHAAVHFYTGAGGSHRGPLGGNVYVTRGYTHTLLEKGSTPSGYRFDEVLYLDMIAEDLQNAAVSLLADNLDKLPQTDDASVQFMNAFSSVLIGYTNRGILATAKWRGAGAGRISAGDYVESGFALWADSYDDQSEADRAAHKAVPIQCALTLAGSLDSVVITVNVRV